MSLELLTNLGFTDSADCLLDPENNLLINIRANANCKNILYAFVIDEERVAYIGKSVNTLQTRLSGYAKPGTGQKTNIKVNAKVIEELCAGKSVKIYSFSEDEMLQFRGVCINLAAGLEDSLIRIVAESNHSNNIPQLWNNRGNPHAGITTTSIAQPAETREEILEDIIDYERNNRVQLVAVESAVFSYTLGSEYWKKNWFNADKKASEFLGPDRTSILVHLTNLSGDDQVISGTINRTAQSNGTPRLMLNTEYHNWIRANFNEGDVVRYEILNPQEIKILQN